jgi:MFS family permease
VAQPSPLEALRIRNFVLFQLARFLSVVGVQAQGVAIGWQIYSITREPIHLGLVGLAQFVPLLLLSLVTGQVADRVDRRSIVAVCHAALALASVVFAFEGAAPVPRLGVFYTVLVGVGVARAFLAPASASLLPNLVPPEVFPNAVAWNSSTWQVATIIGPSLGGLAYGMWAAAPPVYVGCAVLEAGTVLLLFGLRAPAQAVTRGRVDVESLLAGLRYVWRQKLVLGAISLDLFAVLLGGAVALLPVFASDVLNAGPWALGVLRSAPGLGAAVTAIVLAFFPVRRYAGWALFVGVAVFGAATIVFGLSRSLPLSAAALVVVGASDMVSVYVRQSAVQLVTPDAMRGRVSAVNFVFIGASNELGELESGVAAQLLGPVPAVVLGGVGTLIVVLAWALMFPELRRVDRLHELKPSTPA